MPALDPIRALAADLVPDLLPTIPSTDRATSRRPALLAFALHCQAAYGRDDDLAFVKSRSRWSDFVRFRHGNAHGYILAAAEKAVVAIAGTDDLRDWRGNLAACPDPLPGWPSTRAHRGLVRYADSVRAALAPHYHVLRDRIVTVTGHSLGGAAALLLPTLARLDWRLPASIVSAAVVTFGAPRVGNRHLAELRTGWPTLGVIADGDPIPHLPLRGPWIGYRHARELRYLTTDGRLVAGHLAGTLRAARLYAAASVPLPCRRRFVCAIRTAIESHRISTYLARLAQPLLEA